MAGGLLALGEGKLVLAPVRSSDSRPPALPAKGWPELPAINVDTRARDQWPDHPFISAQDKFANKLVTVANNFFQSVYKNMEQSLVFITSPISIMLYQAYVIFILMSTFGLKHNLDI